MDTPLIDQVLRARSQRHRKRALLAFIAGCALAWIIKDPVISHWYSFQQNANVSTSEAGVDKSQTSGKEIALEDLRNNSINEDQARPPLPMPKPRTLSLDEARAILAKKCNVSGQPANGSVFLGSSRGNHTLRIDNYTAHDAIVKVKNGANVDVIAFYVHSNSTVFQHIPDGIYSLYFGHGKNFSAECLEFTQDFTRYRFPGTTSLVTTATPTEITTSELSFTLHTVADGNIERQRVSAEEW